MKRFSERLLRKADLSPRFWVIMPPYVWLVVFMLLPFLFTLKMSFSHNILSNPPFAPLATLLNHTLQLTVDLDNYYFVLSHSLVFIAFLSSFKLALITTLLCIVIGYPFAYAIANSGDRLRKIFFLMVILPYWTSFLLRAYAWIILLQNNGLINQLLQWLGLTKNALPLIYNNFSLCVGLLYGYLPFFVLPLYSSLIKIDPDLLEAAYDLGCKPWRAFWKVTLPLSLPGVLAGSLLVFIPCIGEVVIPQILGGINNFMIGNVIWEEFFIGNNWGKASALAIVMLVVLVIPCVWLQRIQQKRTLS